MKIKILILFLVVVFVKNTFSQYTLNHQIPYSTTNQNMWGPNGSPLNLDFDWELFHVQWDTSAGFSQMTSIFGDSLGIALDAGTWGEIGANFSMHGFTTGWVEVDYPVEIHLTFPDHYTYDMGEWITINSSYDVLPGWNLGTHFPSAGITTFDMDFGFGAHIDFITCIPFVGCDTINIIPPIDIPTDSITIFHLNGQTGYTVYPCIDSLGNFHFCEDSILPIVIPDWFNIGLTGEITLPYVVTNDWLGPDKCLYASGDSAYLFMNLDIVQFLYAVAGLIPPPNGPAIQQALSYLSGSYTFDVGPSQAIIEWNLFSAELDMTSTNQQDFTFCPTIWGNFDLPIPVEWYVTDPFNNNSIVNSGFSDTIRFAVSNDVHIKYPCFNPDSMNLGIEYDFSNDFTNHTWDSISFDFSMTALWFHFYLPTFKMQEAVEIPQFNIQYINEKGKKKEFASREITTQEVIFSGENVQKDIEYEIGPLIDMSIPIGYLPFTWYNNTWDLAGFVQDTVFPGTSLVPNYNPMYISNIDGDDILCFGENTGNLGVTVTNGVPPYTFAWSNGAIYTTNNNFSSIDSLALGTYSVTITDLNDCTLDTSFTLIELNPQIILNLSATDVLCMGDSTGSASVIASGGSPGYTYLWNNGLATSTILNIPSQMYYVTVTDNIGCKVKDSIYVDEPDSYVSSSIVALHVRCFGESNGATDLSVFDGTPGYTYLWSNGSSSQDLTNIPAGDYFVTITDNNGCKNYDTIQITQPDLLTISIQGTNVSCFGMTDGSIDISVTGGTTPYLYYWNNASNSEDLSSLAAGTYIITVIDSHNCRANSSYTVTKPNAPLAISGVLQNVNCYNGSDGTIDISVTGGTSPYSYIWSNNQITEDLNNVNAGIYIVTVVDSHNCSITASFTVTQPFSALNVQYQSENVKCFGGNNASIDLTVSGGTPIYNYNWSNGFIGEDLYSLYAGVYTVTITDLNSCTETISVTISEPFKLNTSILGTNISCFSGANGTINLSVTGGTTPYNYLWNNSSTSEDLNSLISGYYSVTVTDSNGCKAYNNISLSQPNNPILTSIQSTNVSCFGGNNGAANVTVSGGTSPYSYIWNNGNNTSNLSNLQAGTYIVTVTDINGCYKIDSLVISQPLVPISVNETHINVSCNGGNNGSIDLSVSGGTSPYSYIWNNNNMNQDISNLTAGVYSVTVSDSKSCKKYLTVTITQPQKLFISLSPDTIICHGQYTQLSVVSTSGGNSPYTYVWSNGANNSTINVNPIVNATYCAQAVDSRGCISANACVNVYVRPKLEMTLNVNPKSACKGSPVMINATILGGGTPPITTVFQGDTSNSTSFFVYPEFSQTYFVSAMDICNYATITKEVNVSVLPIPENNFTADVFSGCPPLLVNFVETNNQIGYSYSWNFGDIYNNYSSEKNPSHLFTSSGLYNISLKVTSNNGCSKTVTYENMINVYQIPNAEFYANPYVTTIVQPEIDFINNSSDNFSNYWKFGDGNFSYDVNPEHIYRESGIYDVELVVHNSNSCSDTANLQVTINDEYVFYAPTAFTPDNDGKNDEFKVFASGINNDYFELIIYDRWGEKIFQSYDIKQGWDGRAKGGRGICETGVYTWIATYRDLVDNEYQKSGYFTLIK